MVADGVYRGTYHKGRWTHDVEVTVAGHKITSVKNTNSRRTSVAKGFNAKVAAEIIGRQSPRVDAVAGATISSRVFGLAVENALTAGLRR